MSQVQLLAVESEIIIAVTKFVQAYDRKKFHWNATKTKLNSKKFLVHLFTFHFTFLICWYKLLFHRIRRGARKGANIREAAGETAHVAYIFTTNSQIISTRHCNRRDINMWDFNRFYWFKKKKTPVCHAVLAVQLLQP